MPQKLKQNHPEIPWDRIIAQRNVLAHEYGEVLLERIWLVATERIPELLKMLDPLIPTPPIE
ncbi:MAG TPA: HepT-like ribonuclease domain-containing protein [bacterium]